MMLLETFTHSKSIDHLLPSQGENYETFHIYDKCNAFNQYVRIYVCVQLPEFGFDSTMSFTLI
jgi:hypothetical protein